MDINFNIKNISDNLIIFQRKDYVEVYKLKRIFKEWYLIAPEEHQLNAPINKYNGKPKNFEVIKAINIYLMENPWN